MATGLSSGGGVVAPPDVREAGDVEWASVAAVAPSHPYVGGPNVEGLGAFDVDRGRSRFVTTPEGQMGSATGGLMATPDGAGETVSLMEDWRDLANFRGSPMPWLLLLSLAMLGFMQFRVQARGALGNRASVGASAALG